MGGIHPPERYPGWVLQLLFLSAVALAIGAILLLAGLGGLPNNPVLTVHCALNALVLLTVWNGCRTEAEGWWLLQVAANLAAVGLGLVDLVLAGHAAARLQPHNTVLLALVLPGVAGLIAYYLEYFRKQTAEETAAEDEAVLGREVLAAETKEGEPLTFAENFRVYATVVFFYVAYFALFLGGMWLCFFWYGIVWRAVNDGVVFGAWDILLQIWKAIQRGWPAIVRAGLAIAAMMTVSAVWVILQDKFKRFRNRRKQPDAERDARVDAAVRAVWDFANRPGRRAKNIPVYGVPVVLFLAWAASMIAYGANEKQLAFRLFEMQRGVADGWYYFYSTGEGMIFEVVAAGVFFIALWLLLVGVWPGAAEAAVTVRYRRNARDVSSSVEVLRGCLTRLFKNGEGEPFDARTYLLKRRRRFVRWVYAIAAVVVPVALAGMWASLNTYMLLTANGAVRHSLFAPPVSLPWKAVMHVDIACTLDQKGRASLVWRVRTGRGAIADLADGDNIESRLPGLLKVDAILRAQGTGFGPHVPPTPASDACLEKAGAGLRDFRGFLHVMHRD